jgi:predicted RNA binding protein YcfA (HicA-like mRNA interferase family)
MSILSVDSWYYIWYYKEDGMEIYEKIKRNPKNVSPKDLIKLLVSFGFVLRRTSGDHEQYKRPGFRTFPVPIGQNPLSIRIVKEALQVIEEIKETNE